MKRLKPKKEDIFKLTAIVLAALLCVTSSGVDSKAEGETNDYGLRNPRVAFQTRETVYFGNYWQEDTNGDGVADKNDEKTPIQWQVLKKYDDGTVLLLSDKVLDAKIFYNGEEDVDENSEYHYTWEYSDLRKWLNGNNNGDFFKEAFSIEEQKNIILENNINEDNIIYGTKYGSKGGNNTKDKVFVLSLSDIINSEYGFVDGYNEGYRDQNRIANVTNFAINNGVCVNDFYAEIYGKLCGWWIRSPGARSQAFSAVEATGDISMDCSGRGPRGVRPSIRISLSSNVLYGESKRISIKGTEWDTIVFGKYKNEDIIWRVINIDKNIAFIISDKVIEEKRYDEENKYITWKNSSLRKWLNEDFYNSSFNEDERKMISNTKVINGIDFTGNDNGEDTLDKVFLLSLQDVINFSYGFSNMHLVHSRTMRSDDNKSWWLRSIEYSQINQVAISSGTVSGSHPRDDNIYVRPCLHIDLSSSAWKKGEPVKAGDPTGGVEAPIDSNSRTDFPIDNPKKDTTESKQPTDPTNPERPVDSKPTSQDIYRNAGAGVGKISSDGRTLIDTDGKKWFMSSKLTNKDLKKNLDVAVKNGGKYKITKITKKGSKVTGGTVTYMAPYDKNATSMTAPKSVKFGGATFTVTAIGANAFKNNKKLKTATIEGNVTVIGANAFSGCKSLTKVTIKKGSLTSIGTKAFYDCKKLNSFSISGLKLKKVGSSAFKNTNSKITFKCPKSKLKDYEKLFKKAGASKKAKYTK